MSRTHKKLMVSVQQLMAHNKEGSFATHSNRRHQIQQMAQQLSDDGYQLNHIRDLKTKHVDHLIQTWLNKKLSTGTIKNRVSALRWLAHKIGKDNIVKRLNSEYGIENRQYVNNQKNIAKVLTSENLQIIHNEFVQYSLQLQQAFGLRREEAIKFQIHYADQGHYIRLKDTWCKGGRAREIPVVNDAQRQLLNEIREFCHQQEAIALIPKDKNYYQQLKTYEDQTARYQVNKNHGLRHGYAQQRYFDLLGWQPPKLSGPKSRELTPKQKALDRAVRLLISQELGHGREEITAVYLGR